MDQLILCLYVVMIAVFYVGATGKLWYTMLNVVFKSNDWRSNHVSA